MEKATVEETNKNRRIWYIGVVCVCAILIENHNVNDIHILHVMRPQPPTKMAEVCSICGTWLNVKITRLSLQIGI